MGVEGIGESIARGIRGLIGCVVILAIGLLIALAAVGVMAHRCNAQVPFRGVVIEPARSKLVAAWPKDPRANEQVYCVTRWAVGPQAMDHWLYVIDVQPSAPDSTSNPNSTVAICPQPSMPLVHTHTPSTCEFTRTGDVKIDTCKRGGLDAWLCNPSLLDLVGLTKFDQPFGVVQCDRNAFVFYYPLPHVVKDSEP